MSIYTPVRSRDRLFHLLRLPPLSTVAMNPQDAELVDWLHERQTLSIPSLRSLALERDPPWIISEKVRA
jgi:hypothetical protein